MADLTTTDVERQRITHLVMGAPRPKAHAGARRGKRKLMALPKRLAPGIEERVALREEWRGIEGTPETLEFVRRQAERPGCLARLHGTGAVDAHQLAAAEEIRLAYTRTVSDVAVRTANYGRGSGAGRRDGLAGESAAAAWLDIAYTRWRVEAGSHAALLLAIIVDDVALTEAARRYRVSNRRARAILLLALDRWRR